MPPPGLHALRIAVVDVDEGVWDLVRTALERVGATVDLFPSSFWTAPSSPTTTSSSAN